MIDRTKFIPAIVSLFVTLVTTIVMIVNRYETTQALIIILSVLVGSYIVGLILKWVANTFLVVEVKEENENKEVVDGEPQEDKETEGSTQKVVENNE